jgi:hypothetical protein
MSEFDLTHELIIFEELGTPLSKSGDEWRYYCFNCEDKRGKPDKKGKFYFNVVKQKGYCFLCHTSFYVEDEGVDQEELEWERTQNTVLSKLPLAIFDDLEFPKEVHFNFPDLGKDHLKYLKKRNPYLPALKDFLCIKGWNGRESGVVLPFFYRGKICKFQARFLDRKTGAKYFTSPGPKPLYSPLHIMNNFKLSTDESTITICEGVFDAIALFILGFPNPLAILGDKITPLHLYDIRRLSPTVTKSYVCLDDWDRSLMVSKIMRKHIPALQETRIYVKWGGPKADPEDLLNTAINNPNLKAEYLDRVSNLIERIQ